MPPRIGRYAVRRRIGSGAFATVWLAYDEQLDSPVAVKVLAENWTEDHHVRQRFLEEGRFLRKVESPHVVAVYDAGELDDERPYLVMAYADQGTLADRLELGGLTTAQALEVVRQVGSGLTALHERGVLHRDVKPANVLFRTVEGDHGEPVRAMLADLGLGKALDLSSRLSLVAGTPSFVAPEQARGEHLDRRADLYSLAALSYLMLAGHAPFQHASLKAAADPGEPPAMSRDGHPFPDGVEDVVRRALHPDREHRWSDVGSYVAALTAALGDPPAGSMPGPWLPVDPHLTQPGPRPSALPSPELLPEPVPPARVAAWKRWSLGAGAAVLALAAGGGAGYLVHQWRGDTATVTDSTGSLAVTVPEEWTASTRTGEWTPPDQETEFPALSTGTAADWHESAADDEGVFVGILPSEDMPEQLPGHADCGDVTKPVADTVGEDPVRTQVATGCPGVIVERVHQVAVNRYVWIQVRSRDGATANRVLEAIEVSGY